MWRSIVVVTSRRRRCRAHAPLELRRSGAAAPVATSTAARRGAGRCRGRRRSRVRRGRGARRRLPAGSHHARSAPCSGPKPCPPPSPAAAGRGAERRLGGRALGPGAGFVRDVERPHALPAGRRQRRVVTSRGPRYRDVEYLEQRTVVELDGRLVHSAPDVLWQDLERDVDAAISAETTVRLGWVHVAQPCRTAAVLARLLGERGWRGAEPCSPACPVGSVPFLDVARHRAC